MWTKITRPKYARDGLAMQARPKALGDETPARRIAQRLIGEWLDRHDAIHAIGMVLAEHIYDVSKTVKSDTDPNAPYFAALDTRRRSGIEKNAYRSAFQPSFEEGPCPQPTPHPIATQKKLAEVMNPEPE
jgi:hypothetical protein